MNRVIEILKRIDSCHLAKLWSFYRPAFHSDEECLTFLHDVFVFEPPYSHLECKMESLSLECIAEDGTVIEDAAFIPRRMVNAVQRMVQAARDMEQIRPGKDIFKIVYLVTCVETLQAFCNEDPERQESKREMLFLFFESYTAEEDKQYIGTNFQCLEDSIDHTVTACFQQFIGALNEYRNCAAHEGKYWEFCFTSDHDCPTIITLDIDLEKYRRNQKMAHTFSTAITYQAFEAIFIRCCIRCIQQYVAANHGGYHGRICAEVQ